MRAGPAAGPGTPSPGIGLLESPARPRMLESELLSLSESCLRPLGACPDEGESFRSPPLDVLRYFARRVRLSRIPLLGRGLSVVAVVRQPADLGPSRDDVRTLVARVASAVSARYPPARGLSLGLTVLVLAPEPITPEDDGRLADALATPPARSRSVPLGLLRLNLGQEAFAFALARVPLDLFPEPAALADALTPRLRRFVPLIEGLP